MDVRIPSSPPSSYTEVRMPSVMEFGGAGLWEVMRFRWSHERGATLMELVSLWEGESRALSLSGPHEDTARRLSENQEKSQITRYQIRQHPDLGLPSASRTMRSNYCLRPPVCGVVLEQPGATNTEPKQELICHFSVSTQESHVYWRCSSFPGTGSTCGLINSVIQNSGSKKKLQSQRYLGSNSVSVTFQSRVSNYKRNKYSLLSTLISWWGLKDITYTKSNTKCIYKLRSWPIVCFQIIALCRKGLPVYVSKTAHSYHFFFLSEMPKPTAKMYFQING